MLNNNNLSVKKSKTFETLKLLGIEISCKLVFSSCNSHVLKYNTHTGIKLNL